MQNSLSILDRGISSPSTDKEKTKKTSKKKSKSSKSSISASTENVYAQVAERSPSMVEKARASTLSPLTNEEKVEVKERSSSIADSLMRRANSVLRKSMHEDEVGGDKVGGDKVENITGGDRVENIYQQLNQELDKDSDEEGDDCEDSPHETLALDVELPPPRDGQDRYAFEEMRDVLKGMDDDWEATTNVDLKQFSKKHHLQYDEKEEFVAFALLKNYITTLNK